MANIVMSQITSAIVRRGHPIVRYGSLAAATYVPGQWVYTSASNTFTIAGSAVAEAMFKVPLLIDFEPRVASDKARKDIDNQIAISYAPIISGGWTGPLLVGGKVTDPGAGGVLAFERMMLSATAGDMMLSDADKDVQTGGQLNIYAYTDYVDDDLVAELIMIGG